MVRRLATALGRLPLHPSVAIPGFVLASALAGVWGAALSRGALRRVDGLLVARGMPAWSFGRGGTTIGAVYLTDDLDDERALRHEAVHRDQWRRYGLAMIPLYLAAGREATTNRFEIEAGLEDGGYVSLR